MRKSEKTSCAQKKHIWNSSISIFENSKYLESIIGNSEVTHDKIKEVKKIVLTKPV